MEEYYRKLFKIFSVLFQAQKDEENRLSLLYPNREKDIKEDALYKTEILNVFDKEEYWIVDNCKPLFFIEKSSDIIQEIMININEDDNMNYIKSLCEQIKPITLNSHPLLDNILINILSK